MMPSILSGGRPGRLQLRWASDSGQTLIEFALVLPFVMVLLLGVIEVGNTLLDQHIVSKLTREGSNLISRDTSLADAASALRSMASGRVNFNNGSSKVIFSVVKKVATVGATNQNQAVLYQRYVYGTYSGSSMLNNSGGSFGASPEFQANNSDNDPSLRVTNVPATMVPGDMLYITEIYTAHPLITPLDRFGVRMPQTLYSIAYF
jgi:Flp pilus assembly protein TadG